MSGPSLLKDEIEWRAEFGRENCAEPGREFAGEQETDFDSYSRKNAVSEGIRTNSLFPKVALPRFAACDGGRDVGKCTLLATSVESREDVVVSGDVQLTIPSSSSPSPSPSPRQRENHEKKKSISSKFDGPFGPFLTCKPQTKRSGKSNIWKCDVCSPRVL